MHHARTVHDDDTYDSHTCIVSNIAWTLLYGGNENNFDKFKYFYEIPEGWQPDTVNKVRAVSLPLHVSFSLFKIVPDAQDVELSLTPHATLPSDGEVHERDRQPLGEFQGKKRNSHSLTKV